jgi:hypothetical protein
MHYIRGLFEFTRFWHELFGVGVRLSPLGTAAATDLLYQPRIIDDGDCGAGSGMGICRGTEVLEVSCHSATSSTTNLIWFDLGSNLERRGGKPATNRLSYGTALNITFLDVPAVIRGA